jgi:hypothetical protein
VGAGSAIGLAAADRLEPVGNARLTPIRGFEVITHLDEKALHEDRHPAQIVSIEPAKVAVQLPVEGHLRYNLPKNLRRF